MRGGSGARGGTMTKQRILSTPFLSEVIASPDAIKRA